MSVHLATRKIIKEWTDYNEHMNMAYYVLIFDEAWEIMLNKFHMGGSNAQISKRSTMVVDTRTTYNNEVKEMMKWKYFVLFLIMIKRDFTLNVKCMKKNQKNLLQL